MRIGELADAVGALAQAGRAAVDAGYADQPDEVITYVDAHDNETLFDILQYKLPTGTPMADRVRMNTVALSTVALGHDRTPAGSASDGVRPALAAVAAAGLVGAGAIAVVLASVARRRRREEPVPTPPVAPPVAPSLAFLGIAVALLGRNKPGGIAVAALLFAFLDRGQGALQFADIPASVAREGFERMLEGRTAGKIVFTT